MKHIIFGVLFFVIWLVVSSYWYVCGVRNLCEQTKTQQVLLPQELASSVKKEPIPSIVPTPIPAPMAEIKIEEKKEYTLPVIYFIPEMDSVKNVEELIAAYKMISLHVKENDKLKLYITGHASDGEAQDATILGLQRAESIKEYMAGRGIQLDKIVTSSRGNSEPKGSNDTQEGKLLNRRVEMVLK